MDEIIETQRECAKPLTRKDFLVSVAAIVLRLTVMQLTVYFAILLTGVNALNLAVYAYACRLLWLFLRRVTASYFYTLKTQTLVLQRRIGDSTTGLVEIPLKHIRAVRPVCFGEDMRLYDRRVTTIDSACRPPLRVRAGFALSRISAHAARAAAGKLAYQRAGYVVVYEESGALRYCLFRPKAQLCAALADALGSAFGADDLEGTKPLDGVYARCLQKAFPELYPHVRPMMDPTQVEAARRELAERRQKRKTKKEARPSCAARKKSGEKHEVHDDPV